MQIETLNTDPLKYHFLLRSREFDLIIIMYCQHCYLCRLSRRRGKSRLDQPITWLAIAITAFPRQSPKREAKGRSTSRSQRHSSLLSVEGSRVVSIPFSQTARRDGFHHPAFPLRPEADCCLSVHCRLENRILLDQGSGCDSRRPQASPDEEQCDGSRWIPCDCTETDSSPIAPLVFPPG